MSERLIDLVLDGGSMIVDGLPDGTLERVDQWEVRINGRSLPELLPPTIVDPARTPIRKTVCHAQELLDTG